MAGRTIGDASRGSCIHGRESCRHSPEVFGNDPLSWFHHNRLDVDGPRQRIGWRGPSTFIGFGF
ncbi:hypothetical protein [Amycolatopsis thailandensis]|uniref:hypothetical protein n=1 Tax=Amycolatopsis thailandensis TaxID=589330 RepID=UPI00362AABF5